MTFSMPETSDDPSMRKSASRTLKDKLEALETQRRAAIEAEAIRLRAEYSGFDFDPSSSR
jgi:hypothetical protein